VNGKDSNGFTALHYAARRASPSRFSIVQMLLAAGAEIHATGCTGQTPLHSAVSGSCPAAVTLLLSAGAAADAADLLGMTPLSGAAMTASESLSWRSRPELQARAAETFNCFMAHNSTQPLAPAVLVAAAALAAGRLPRLGGRVAYELNSRHRAVIRRLLSTAVQQDIAATRAALLLRHGLRGCIDPWIGATMLTDVLLGMWLAAAADQAELEAWLPTMQQMFVRVAAEQAEQHAL
jgi:hypothetical protein